MFQALSHSHRLHDLLHEYPIDLVFNLYRAEMENRQDELRAEMIAQALGVSKAIENGMDLLLNKGEGQVFSAWLKAMDGPVECNERGGGGKPNKPKPARSKLSPDAIAFFSGLPVKPKKD